MLRSMRDLPVLPVAFSVPASIRSYALTGLSRNACTFVDICECAFSDLDALVPLSV